MKPLEGRLRGDPECKPPFRGDAGVIRILSSVLCLQFSEMENCIYLVSRSLRRRELLRQIHVNFEVLLLRAGADRGSDVDETVLPNESPADYVTRIARIKARMGWLRMTQRGLPDRPVLAADTTVVLDDAILGKPANADAAAAMLTQLSGRQHQVLTSVAVCCNQKLETRLCASHVAFRALDEAEIRRYVATEEPLDKAGSYAIQGLAAVFISQLCGSYSGVMGLPLYETEQLLRSFGHPVL
jgi:septum formation protein